MDTGIRFKGIHSEDIGVLVRTKNRPILPEEKQRTIESNAIDGIIDLSQTDYQEHPFYQERIFQSDILVTGKDIYDLQKRVSKAAAWLMGSGDLIYDDMPYVIWKARVISGVDFAPQIYGTQAVLSVSFQVDTWSECKYSTEELDDMPLDSEILLDSDIQLDMSEYFQYPLTAGRNTITVTNLGTVYVQPVLRFTGQSDYLVITCRDDTLTYSQPFSALNIDCKAQSVTENDVVKTQYASGTFPELAAGETTMTIKATGDIDLFIFYTPRFIYNDTIIEGE